MLAPAIAFVDLETTGTTPTGDRVTEIGIVRVVDGALAEEWSTLVNPECPIPEEIGLLTGISNAMVRGKPTFSELRREVGIRAGALSRARVRRDRGRGAPPAEDAEPAAATAARRSRASSRRAGRVSLLRRQRPAALHRQEREPARSHPLAFLERLPVG